MAKEYVLQNSDGQYYSDPNGNAMKFDTREAAEKFKKEKKLQNFQVIERDDFRTRAIGSMKGGIVDATAAYNVATTELKSTIPKKE